MTTQPNTLDCNKLGSLLEEVLGCSTPVESIKRKLRYDIGVDDDTHWALVSIAAKNKLHQEDFHRMLKILLSGWRGYLTQPMKTTWQQHQNFCGI